MRKKIINQKSAFSIIELVVVIIVISIITTLSAIGYVSWKNHSDEEKTKADLMSLRSDLSNYHHDNNQYPLNSDLSDASWSMDNIELSADLKADGVTYSSETGQSYTLDKQVIGSDIKYRITDQSSQPTKL